MLPPWWSYPVICLTFLEVSSTIGFWRGIYSYFSNIVNVTSLLELSGYLINPLRSLMEQTIQHNTRCYNVSPRLTTSLPSFLGDKRGVQLVTAKRALYMCMFSIARWSIFRWLQNSRAEYFRVLRMMWWQNQPPFWFTRPRAVFNWVSKVMLCLLWFGLFYFALWLVKNLAPFLQPIRSKTKTNRDLLAPVFPRLTLAKLNLYLPQFLIGSFCVLSLLWLARVITFVLLYQIVGLDLAQMITTKS